MDVMGDASKVMSENRSHFTDQGMRDQQQTSCMLVAILVALRCYQFKT